MIIDADKSTIPTKHHNHEKSVKCIQKNIIKHHNHEFTAAQIKEQKQFGIALKQNKAQIIFSGSFKDGLSFLKETGNLVDTINNS